MGGRRAALSPAEALLLFLGTLALLGSVGGWLQGRLGLGGLALTELLLVAGPTVLLAGALGVSPSGLGLRRTSARALVGGALAGAGGFYLVSAGIEAALERVAPLPEELKAQLRALIASPNRSVAVELAVLALAPAICEELLFRGALLEAWRRLPGRGPSGLVPVAAAGASALAFGFFHLSLYKLVPTAALGALAAALALRARSIAPAIALHAVNNALVIVLVRLGYEDPPPIGSLLGVGFAVASLAAIAAGIALAAPSRDVPASPP